MSRALEKSVSQLAGRRNAHWMAAWSAILGSLSALVVGATLVSGSVASAARPASADCLWLHLPESARGEIIRAYSQGGADAISAVAVDNTTIRAAAHACGVGLLDDRHMQAAGAAIAGAALEHAAGNALALKGIPAARLERAWASSPAPEKALVLQNATSSGPTDLAASRQFFKAMANFAIRAGAKLPASPSPMKDMTFRTYVDYFLGRAQREGFRQMWMTPR
jgi:hypothetical protein